MYGLVNRAVEQLVCAKFGDDAWGKVIEKAGVGKEHFTAMASYDDDVTYRLIGAVSSELELDVDDALREFGRFWVMYTVQEGYADLMDMSGDTTFESLENINLIHDRIRMSMPELKPPQFECHMLSDHEMKVFYRSDRDGLTQMVVGLIEGLGERHNESLEVDVVAEKSKGAEHDEFLVRLASPNVT